MDHTIIPSLFGAAGKPGAGRPGAAPPKPAREPHAPRGLLDLLYDGFYMVFLLREGYAPQSEALFRARVRSFLAEFDRGASRLNIAAEDAQEAKYAFSALVDEVVMTSCPSIAAEWQGQTLQLDLYGDNLAGERFFEKLDNLRQRGAARLPVLEVFHLCLLLGFQGRYVVEGSEKLNFLTARVGEEIALLRGRKAPFAPHALAPDRISHKLRHEVPIWALGSVFALLGLLAYIGLAWQLGRQTQSDLSAYNGVINMQKQAQVVITLP